MNVTVPQTPPWLRCSQRAALQLGCGSYAQCVATVDLWALLCILAPQMSPGPWASITLSLRLSIAAAARIGEAWLDSVLMQRGIQIGSTGLEHGWRWWSGTAGTE